MFTVYKTDNHHSYASRDLIGLSESFEGSVSLIKKKIIKDVDEDLNEDQMHNLQNLSQTQGYEGSGEFLISEEPIEELI